MAIITSFRDDAMPSIDQDVVHVQKKFSVINGSAALNDTINVMGIAPSQKGVLTHAVLRTSASLGAGATAQLRVAGSAITPATTAAAASKVDSSAQASVPLNVSGGDLIDILIAGAGITAAADITVDLFFANRS